MKPQDFTGKGNYIISYLLDGWLKETMIPANNANQLLMRWQAFAATVGATLNSVTAVERM